MGPVAHPLLCQINTRVWLSRWSRAIGRRATLDDVPDGELDRIQERGFDWVWLLGVWRTGTAGRRLSRRLRGARREFEAVLPDVVDEDIGGSCFAVTGYRVEERLGGDAALERLRARFAARGLRLMLDFIPNHVALDHPWLEEHPEFFVRGSEEDLMRTPGNHCRIRTGQGRWILAHGRDPNFPAWRDTLQLNHGNARLRGALAGELAGVAARCDGVRCDMAMLVLPAVFRRTWGIEAETFWPGAIAAVRRRRPGFVFLAEVYWDLEGELLEQGFDYCYDKRLYDLLRGEDVETLRRHLFSGWEHPGRAVRFLENHDEPRAAATFDPGRHQAAAVITYLAPGLRFFQEGQLEGHTIRVPVHLERGPDEPTDAEVAGFYDRLMGVLGRPEVRGGRWRWIEVDAAWEGNSTWREFLAWAWEGGDGRRVLVVVRYAAGAGQCYLPLRWEDLRGRTVRLRDLLGTAEYDRDGSELVGRGLYVDLPGWGHHVFEMVTG